MDIQFCVITATSPNCVTKEFTLVDGQLKKKTTASVYEGYMQIQSIVNPAGFAKVLDSLDTNQCLTYGLPPHDAELITEEDWIKRGCPDGPLPRTNSVFTWSTGPGILMLDYDAPKDDTKPLGKKALVSLLLNACPMLRDGCSVWWPSPSSHIYSGETEINGLKGQRFYLFVNDASDIERAGAALNERLWAQGHGRFEISQSGSLLKRSVFDGAVWQSNRIDFAAGAKCGPGVEQRRGNPLMLGDGSIGNLLDTRTAIPDLSDKEKLLATANQNTAKAALKNQAEQIKLDWIKNQAKVIQASNPRLNFNEATMLARRAVESQDLMGDWRLTIKEAGGSEKEITVLEALDHPEIYHGCLTLDPLEPDYDGRRWVGKLYLLAARPNLNSFAHGGRNFRLHRHPKSIELITGKGRQTTDALLDVLRQSPDIFDFGGELVRVGEVGALHPLDEHSLRYFAGGLVQFWRKKMTSTGPIDVLCDPPPPICKNVLALGSLRNLKRLNSVITAPTLRPDGSVLDTLGYDTKTQLLYDAMDGSQSVPAFPTRQQALQALDELWLPFTDFPFCRPLDRAVHLAALLTTSVRASLPSSPGFAYDAPIQGSGKTLLARCVGVLAQGSDPSVWPHTAGRDDEEVRKRLFTVLRTGAKVLIWDNVVGSFDSAAMASCMTSPTFSDRILGQSVSSTVPNRMIVILTGNNITLQGEMPRRTLVCRIDPRTERPFARSFNLDPYLHCKQHRPRMLVAALTLIRASLSHGGGKAAVGRLASFEEWDSWVRRAVIFSDELKPGMFGDVMEGIHANQSADPEQEALASLLAAWVKVFGMSPISTSELLAAANDIFNDNDKLRLREAIEAVTNSERGKLSAKGLGRHLGYRIGRIAGGRLLEKGPKTEDRQTWRVKAV